jgi:hypothetical protein
LSKEFPIERERLTPEDRKTNDAERRLHARKNCESINLRRWRATRTSERLRAERLAGEAVVKNEVASVGGLLHLERHLLARNG